MDLLTSNALGKENKNITRSLFHWTGDFNVSITLSMNDSCGHYSKQPPDPQLTIQLTNVPTNEPLKVWNVNGN